MFISHLLTRNAHVEADLVDQLFNSSEKRLARLLLLMANFGKEGEAKTSHSQTQSGNAARDDRNSGARISAFMNKFRELGFIKYNGDLKVHNSLLNMILHDTPGTQARTRGCLIPIEPSGLLFAVCAKEYSHTASGLLRSYQTPAPFS